MNNTQISRPEKKVNWTEAREELRRWAVKWADGCEVQDGWPCWTCFFPVLVSIGLNPKTPEFHEYNAPVDRINEVWRAVIQIRETDLGRENEE